MKYDLVVSREENTDVSMVQWRIPAEQWTSLERGVPLISAPFSARGLQNLSLHFYPKGDDFAEEGFCSLYFMIPKDTRVRRRLFVGRTLHDAEVAEGTKHVGLSNAAMLAEQMVDGSVIVGVTELEVVEARADVADVV